MPFSETSQDLMSYFFDIYENYNYDKTKYNQKQMDIIYKKFYRELLLAKNIYIKYNKHKIKKSVKEIKTTIDIPRIDLLKSKYIHESISNHIKTKMTALLDVNFKIGDVTVNCHFGIFSKKNYADLNKYDNYIKKIFIFLTFLFSSMRKPKPKSISFYLFLTNKKKSIPKNGFSILGPLNCNSGLTYGCQSDGSVFIYREEEWFKVFIHETFHCLCLDFNSLHCENLNKKFKKNIINVQSKLNLYESYTEYWSTIIHSCMTAFELSFKQDNKEDTFLLYLDFILHYEKIFSLFQCVKVLDHMGLTYKNLIDKDEISNGLRLLYYKEETNVFSYYIVKAVLLYYKEDFMLWCKEKNKCAIFNFAKTQENLDLFLFFLREKMVNDRIIKDMDMSMLFLYKLKKKFTYPRKNSLLKTMRMTIVENK